MDQSGNPEQHPSDELHDAAYPVSDYQPRNVNEIHDAAYPVSDYQPGNHNNSEPGPSSPPENAANSKYTELATPALAFTSGQASSSWHGAGPSHLDNALDPPPSYEQSQSHSQPRSEPQSQGQSQSQSQSPATTSSQPSASLPSIIPPNGNASPPHSPEATPQSVTPLQPIPTHNSAQPSGPQLPGHYPPPADGAPTYGPMPAIGYQKPERPTTLERLRRKSCYTTLLLIGVFLLALFVGLMIGFREKLDDEEPEDDVRRSGSNQLFREAGSDPPSETTTTIHYWS